MKTERQACFDALMNVYEGGGYSNLTLNRTLREDALRSGFVSALFYGVMERDITLGAWIDRLSKRPCRKLDRAVAVILKMGLYQLLYLDSVPDRAAVNESVKLCSYARKSSAGGLVNAVLRGAVRAGKTLDLSGLEEIPALSIRYSCPQWLLRQWGREYSPETARALAEASVGRPPLTIRVNTLKTDDASLEAALTRAGVTAEPSAFLPHCFHLSRTGSLEDLPQFRDGHFYVQDLSSQWCAHLLDTAPGMTVLDLCSAPGSKAFTAAQPMAGEGRLIARDLHAHKAKLVREGAERLGITNLTAETGDAGVFDPALPQADRVLCDVPCAGLGIIRRKPEIKYKDPQSLRGLPQVQYRILETAARYVRPGGKLVYATCSLSRDENEAVVERFLEEHPRFSLLPAPRKLHGRVLDRGGMMTFLPQYMDSDGFFTAVLQTNREGR